MRMISPIFFLGFAIHFLELVFKLFAILLHKFVFYFKSTFISIVFLDVDAVFNPHRMATARLVAMSLHMVTVAGQLFGRKKHFGWIAIHKLHHI